MEKKNCACFKRSNCWLLGAVAAFLACSFFARAIANANVNLSGLSAHDCIAAPFEVLGGTMQHVDRKVCRRWGRC